MGDPSPFGNPPGVSNPLLPGSSPISPGSTAPAAALARLQRAMRIPGIPSERLQEINNLNQLDILARQWYRFSCDRPTILYAINSEVVPVLGGATLAGSQYEIYYAPNYQPDPSAFAINNMLKVAQVSVGAGIVYLPTPGKWSIWWNALNSLSKLHLMVIDATDPNVAARYLWEAGIHRISTNAVAVAGAADSEILAENRLRKGFLLQNVNTAGGDARLGFNAVAAAGAGAILQAPAATKPAWQFGMSGDSCFKGSIHAIRDAGVDANLVVLEWY